MSLLPLAEQIKKDIINKETQKREEYKKYIDEHIANVLLAFKYFSDISWGGIVKDTIDEIISSKQIESHDESKYSDEEFEQYRRYFYPINNTEKEDSEEDYENAWKHHYMNNPHHWNYWLDENNVPKDMDLNYIIEMICDWEAMSLKFGGDCESWYYEQNDIILSEKTKDRLEKMLKIYTLHLKRQGVVG